MLTQEDSECNSTPKHAAKSRLFWELKAEQVLNRIFDEHQRNVSIKSSDTFTDIKVVDFTSLRAEKTKESSQTIDWTVWPSSKAWLALSATGLATLLLTTIVFSSRQRYQLDQESNLRLLSLLRQQETPELSQRSNQSETTNTSSNPYPPPPPNEEWIEELAQLPQSAGQATELLKVPLNGAHATLPISTSTTTLPKPSRNVENTVPKLVGVIQGAGTSGSAIFQWGGSSTSVNSGETIGTSTWRLKAVGGSSAIIERNGQQQRISINGNN